ncbi:MAG: methylated-DNA--[protein]-cysteine S-methyltransferase [Acidimicrobiales bacterium]
MKSFLANVPSPVGPWGVEGTEDVISAIYLPTQRRRASRGVAPRAVASGATQLREYFEGERRDFDVTLEEPAATMFQRDVWRALAAIPYGEVRTYAELARDVGRARAWRAVANANRANPWPVIVPCHRVVATGGLGGYGGSSDDASEVKRYLLTLENADFSLR